MFNAYILILSSYPLLTEINPMSDGSFGGLAPVITASIIIADILRVIGGGSVVMMMMAISILFCVPASITLSRIAIESATRVR